MINSWDDVSARICLLSMGLCMDFLCEKRITQVTMYLLHMRFTYLPKDNQQGCSGISNWLSLRCLETWMHHVTLVWWSIFRFMFFTWQLACKLDTVEGKCFYWFIAFKFCCHVRRWVKLSVLISCIASTSLPAKYVPQLAVFYQLVYFSGLIIHADAISLEVHRHNCVSMKTINHLDAHTHTHIHIYIYDNIVCKIIFSALNTSLTLHRRLK